MKGLAVDDPIQCEGPDGEKRYIAGLRCPSGREYSYSGVRFIPVEEAPGKILDEYRLTCGCKKHQLTLYFDMYHGELKRFRGW